MKERDNFEVTFIEREEGLGGWLTPCPICKLRLAALTEPGLMQELLGHMNLVHGGKEH